jgi:hypothetical protein
VSHETDPIGERIRAASQGVSAPLALREHLSRANRPRRRQPPRLVIVAIGFVLAAAATISAIVTPSAPTVERVAAAVLRAPQGPAPSGESYLRGFRAVGLRTDTVGGRHARTVIYRRGALAVHYTIVDGKPLALPGSSRMRVGALTVALARDGDTAIVAWHQHGKTCILATRDRGQDAAALAGLLRRA